MNAHQYAAVQAADQLCEDLFDNTQTRWGERYEAAREQWSRLVEDCDHLLPDGSSAIVDGGVAWHDHYRSARPMRKSVFRHCGICWRFGSPRTLEPGVVVEVR